MYFMSLSSDNNYINVVILLLLDSDNIIETFIYNHILIKSTMVKKTLKNIINSSILRKGRKGIISTLAGLAMTIPGFAQDGSGTLQFVTADDPSIYELVPNAEAEKLIGPDAGNIIDLENYYTNEEGNFSGWTSENLGVAEFNAGLVNHYMLGNPSAELDFIVKTNNPEKLKTEVYDILGRKVATPKAENLFDGTAEVYANASHLANGTYIVQVKDENKFSSFKFIKSNGIADGPNGPAHNSAQRLAEASKKNNSNNSTAQRTSSPQGEVNYEIRYGGINLPGNSRVLAGSKQVEVVQGDSNAITIDMSLYQNSTGDVAIEPMLNGTPKANTNITLTELTGPQNTYTVNNAGTQEIFWNVSVPDNTTASQYEVSITSNDGTFLPTITTIDVSQDEVDEGGVVVNGSIQTNLNELPDNVTWNIDVEYPGTNNPEPNSLVEILEDGTTNVAHQIITDSNGEGIISGIQPGNYQVRISKSGNYYDVFYKTQTVQSPTSADEVVQNVNFWTGPKVEYEGTSTFLTADRVNESVEDFKIPSVWLEGKAVVYLPPSPNRDFYIDQFNQLTDHLGGPRITFTDVQQTSPTQSEIDNYIPNSNVSYGSNLEWTGTNTTGIEANYQNQSYILAANPYKIGGNPSDLAPLFHETNTWFFGFGPSSGYPTSTNTNGAENVSYFDSSDDMASMPYTITYANGKLDEEISIMPDHLEEQ